MRSNDSAKKITRLAMLTALSVVLVYLIHFPIFPAAPFLEYDPADIPILISGLMYGPGAGLIVTAAASIAQGLTVSSGSGVIGILMHFLATGSMVLVSSLLYKKTGKLLPALGAGALTMVVAMCGCNLIFTPLFMGASLKDVADMLIPVIIPFNAIKAGINCLAAGLIFKALSAIVKD